MTEDAPMTTLEKVAKAICCPEGCKGDDKDKFPSWVCHREQEFVLERARAALEALKGLDASTIEAMTATAGMKEVDAMIGFCAARNSGHVLGWSGRGEDLPLVQAWTAGLDHILKGDG